MTDNSPALPLGGPFLLAPLTASYFKSGVPKLREASSAGLLPESTDLLIIGERCQFEGRFNTTKACPYGNFNGWIRLRQAERWGVGDVLRYWVTPPPPYGPRRRHVTFEKVNSGPEGRADQELPDVLAPSADARPKVAESVSVRRAAVLKSRHSLSRSASDEVESATEPGTASSSSSGSASYVPDRTEFQDSLLTEEVNNRQFSFKRRKTETGVAMSSRQLSEDEPQAQSESTQRRDSAAPKIAVEANSTDQGKLKSVTQVQRPSQTRLCKSVSEVASMVCEAKPGVTSHNLLHGNNVKPQGAMAKAYLASVAALSPTDKALLHSPGGDGHERGVQAWVGKHRTASGWYPVGPWLDHRLLGTATGRCGIDKRHLTTNRSVPGGTKYQRAVPGWIGVAVQEDERWSPEYKGSYHACMWDRTAACKRYLPYELSTPEEAARLYDKIAWAYNSGINCTDTNFPPASRPANEAVPATNQGNNPPGQIVMVAAQLITLAHSLPTQAMMDTFAEEWKGWEDEAMIHVTQVPTSDSVLRLALLLESLVSQVQSVVIMPEWRGDRLEAFLKQCRECSVVGCKTDHCFSEATSCDFCIFNQKAGHHFGKGACSHNRGGLMPLVRCAMDFIISHSVCETLMEGDADTAEAVAQEEQASRDEQRAAKLATLQVPRTSASAPTKKCKSEGLKAIAAAARSGAKLRYDPKAAKKSGCQPSASQSDAKECMLPVQLPRAPDKAPLTVVVVGGGVSGLNAALELSRRGAKVTLLEAAGRLGGRMHTMHLSGGGLSADVDLGASFICGTGRVKPINPMLLYVQDTLGLKTVPKMRTGPGASVLYDLAADDVDKVLQESACRNAENVFDELSETLKEMSSTQPFTLSIQDAVNEKLQGLQLAPQERRIVEAFFSDLYVTELSNLSLRGTVCHGFDGDHELVQGGYSQVIEALRNGQASGGNAAKAAPLTDVRLNTRVQAVALNSSGTGVRVYLQDQEQPLQAHAVIVTVSLGVLQSGNIKFDPPLPRFKLDAMEGLKMGTENRVVLLFKSAFWPAAHFLRPLQGRYTYMNLHALGVTGVLCAWVRPHAITEVEAMTDEAAVADVCGQLQMLFGTEFEEPVASHVTRWASDPNTYGAYSYVPHNGKRKNYRTMAIPLSGNASEDEKQHIQNSGFQPSRETRLFFAGEATNADDAYTTHGAFTSGKREAMRVCKWWRTFHSRMADDDSQ